MQRLFLFIILPCIVFLSGCSLPGTTSENSTDVSREYTGSGFSLQVPKNWSWSTNTLAQPHIGEIVLSLVSPDTQYNFSNNLVVMRDTLNGMITSSRYSQLNNIQTSKHYTEYTKLQDDPIIFADSDTSRVYVFEAKYNPNVPRLKFVQTAKVCGTKVYLIHFSLALDRGPDPYIRLAKTFTCQ